ncbi:heme o synthase [Burkholderia vietnamiensis]|uniref:heme o synthase n=1 Tax=Burkholderia vietnamiensis TaxID=60552 RepID=UPI001D14F777|nr:heme o synthase [Burkholderia vietnamiensis]UEC03085.1 heme o synthase [Burkholderia vietnamiensis]
MHSERTGQRAGAELRRWLQLVKPGIVMGNMISVTGGFLLASRGDVNWMQGFLVALGVALVIASGCVVNNVVDRDIDGLMTRTRRRPMVTGEATIPAAMAYAGLLGVSGVALLRVATGLWLPVVLAVIGYVVYVGLYTLYLKRNSIYGTAVGSLSGAMPPVIGYCAVSGRFDAAALTLLVMFSLWQMPHSYAIAIFRAADYRAASIPVMPVVKGFPAAKRSMLLYICSFTVAALMLGVLGYAGWLYMLATLACGAYWFRLGLAGWGENDEPRWARRVFFTSIAVIAVLSLAMSVDFYPASAAVVAQGQ